MSVVFSLFSLLLSYEENEMGICEIPQTKRLRNADSVCSDGYVRQNDSFSGLNEIIRSFVSNVVTL